MKNKSTDKQTSLGSFLYHKTYSRLMEEFKDCENKNNKSDEDTDKPKSQLPNKNEYERNVKGDNDSSFYSLMYNCKLLSNK